MATIPSSSQISRSRTVSITSGRSSNKSAIRTTDINDFTLSPQGIMRYFEPCAATAAMFLYAQGNAVVCCHHDTLTIERRFSMHKDEIQLLAVDNHSELGAGRLVVSYDSGQTAIVWDLMTGDEVARFASFEHLTVSAWMKNGNVAFGNTQGSIIQFEPTTSEHISTRTIDQIAVTALAPSADCRTFAIGYQNGSLLIATLQPRFTILHHLNTHRAPSPIVSLQWHASSPKQKSDMLAVQTLDGDLRVWSVSKSYSSHDVAKVVRILKKTENYIPGPNWMGWSKNGRIIQFSESETLSWDVRTKHVTSDSIPTLDHVRGLAVYGPGATLFTLGASNTVQQFDLNTPAVMVRNVQHPANLLPPSPPVSIEEQMDQGNTSSAINSETESMSVPLSNEIVSESDEDQMSPLARIARNNEPVSDTSDQELYRTASPVSTRSHRSTLSKSSAGSRTHGPAYSGSTISGPTENTYISAGSSLRSSRVTGPYRERDPYRDTYSISSVSSASIASSTSGRPRQRPSRLRNEVIASPEDNKVTDLFKYTRSRLSDIPYKRPPTLDNSRLTNDDLRRQMLSTIFGWHKEMEDLVRDEMTRHPNGAPSRILLAKWLGDIDADIMTTSSESMTSSDWMLLALSGIGGQASQHKLGRAYVQRLLENGDVNVASTILIGMGDHNDAIEIYISHKKYLEALILTCLFFPSTWERQSQIIKKWGEWAVQHGHQQLAIRCFACTGKESSEPWSSPSAVQVKFQQGVTASIPEILSPPLSPPAMNRGPQRSIAKTSALKLITSFGDQSGTSKFFSQGDGGQTPLAAGVTPIAESAVSPSMRFDDPATAFLRPSQRSAFNTPSSARPRDGGFGRPRLPSIGEVPSDFSPHALKAPTTLEQEQTQRSTRRALHSRRSSGEEQMAVGMSVPRAATASPQMVRGYNKDVANPPPPSPSPQSLAALMAQGRTSRNGPRERIPQGVSLELNSLDSTMLHDVTSPEQSVTSSARFHWPKRRGPGSVASSLTSNSSTGRSHRSRNAGRSLDDYIHSLDAAQHYSRGGKSRQSSREGRSGRDRSQTRASSRGHSQERGRSASRNWTPKPKRSPTSPVPMSPEDLINLSTPKISDTKVSGGVPSMDLEPATARKSTSVVRRSSPVRQKASSRASSRSTRRRSPDRRPAALDLRGRTDNRDGSAVRSPSSPLPMSAQAAHFVGSEDEDDYKKALEEQEKFRTRHNRSVNRGMKDPSSPVISRHRERSQSRHRKARNSPENGQRKLSIQSDSKHPRGNLRSVKDERQVKKEAAARELEERRKSLARRPSAPPILHPDELSPAVGRNPMTFEFVPPNDLPVRSQTTEPDATRSMYASRNGGPVMGLPATPKAMRLKFEADGKSAPSVPPLPANLMSLSPSRSSHSSPRKAPMKEHSPKDPGNQGGDLLTLLPSTVYSPPTRNPIPRSMSAPIPEELLLPNMSTHPAFQNSVLSRGQTSRKVNPGESVPGTLLYESTHPGNRSMRGIDKVVNSNQQSSGRRPSYDDQIPPPPPPPPVLKELQHLAVPPPPPPAPLPNTQLDKPLIYGSGNGSGVIEIVMDEDEKQQVPAAIPMSEQVVPILSPPAPPASREGHRRGRSITDNSIAGRISRATERMRSASRSRNNASAASRTMSPDYAPYESLPPPVSYTGPPAHREHPIERHPREVKAGHTQQEFRTGLLESEMI